MNGQNPCAEHIGGVGYINDQMQHVLLSFCNPSLQSASPGFVQVAITIDTAITLRAELNAFLAQHGVKAN